MNFGERLRYLIKEKNLTQKEVANKLNIAPSTLGSYVQNKREPDFITLKHIANFFNVSIDYLLDNCMARNESKNESELLRVFRLLTSEQQLICIEQCKAFYKINSRQEKLKSS